MEKFSLTSLFPTTSIYKIKHVAYVGLNVGRVQNDVHVAFLQETRKCFDRLDVTRIIVRVEKEHLGPQ